MGEEAISVLDRGQGNTKGGFYVAKELVRMCPLGNIGWRTSTVNSQTLFVPPPSRALASSHCFALPQTPLEGGFDKTRETRKVE